MKTDTLVPVPAPINEPVRNYAPGDAHRASLKSELKRMAGEKLEIPCIIGGKEVRTGRLRKVVMPHDHAHVLAEYHVAGPEELKAAAAAATKAKGEWEAMSWRQRSAIFIKAAELLAGPWRDRMNAATMLGQSKSVYQAEIDAACEMIDFFRFNPHYYEQILGMQPVSGPGVWNQLDYRPLEGFVLAVTPFNFTAIAGNLTGAPAMVGNTVVWKPANTQMLSAYYIMKLFEAAGLPPGVINLVCADGATVGDVCLPMPDLAGVHFTGSTGVFQSIFRTVGANIANYKTYPRLVGETGGKDFIFAHPSAEVDALVAGLVRGAFEYQGQKCSACSRTYIPKSLWPKVKERLVGEIKTIKMGDTRDFSNFMNAVIDDRSFKNIQGYLEYASGSSEAEILTGGRGDSSKGYFVEPTVIQTTNPKFKTMAEEIFGPVLTAFVYDDAKLAETVELCANTSPYALTGAIFAQDATAVTALTNSFRNSAGNFYINDKCTGAVVGQQPFGGARASGTNDKAGSHLNLLRWMSPRTIKETFVPARDYRYSFLQES
ncbi:MAG: L-glutamate gamma-semialdehyde dehydrogenase [Bacteriovoracia bacterium]